LNAMILSSLENREETMKITEKTKVNVVVLKFVGSLLGEPDTTKVRRKVRRLVEEEVRKVVVDMSDLRWINSDGLGSLIAGLSSLRNAGGDLRLAKVSDNVQKILRITGLAKVFKVYSTVDAAVNRFK